MRGPRPQTKNTAAIAAVIASEKHIIHGTSMYVCMCKVNGPNPNRDTPSLSLIRRNMAMVPSALRIVCPNVPTGIRTNFVYQISEISEDNSQSTPEEHGFEHVGTSRVVFKRAYQVLFEKIGKNTTEMKKAAIVIKNK